MAPTNIGVIFLCPISDTPLSQTNNKKLIFDIKVTLKPKFKGLFLACFLAHQQLIIIEAFSL